MPRPNGDMLTNAGLGLIVFSAFWGPALLALVCKTLGLKGVARAIKQRHVTICFVMALTGIALLLIGSDVPSLKGNAGSNYGEHSRH